jgi:pimeloyl-ACP methyl ester carboxylesterase
MIGAMQREAMHRSAVGLLDNDELPYLPSVDTPALVVVGSRDALTPAWHSRRMARALPDAELVLLPGAGHQLMLERPRELNDLLERFTERVGSAAPRS